jgi:hypothetical protein
MNSNDKGGRTEAVVLSELAKAGYTVLVPFGVARYDLAIDDRTGAGIRTVQCKTGRFGKGCIEFAASSSDRVTDSQRNLRRGYRGQVDYFGVWCPARPEFVYLVPVEDVSQSVGFLRLEPVRNGQVKGIRWASEYEVKGT